MKYRRIKKNIKKLLDSETEILDNMNTEQAQSGKWAECNTVHLVQEAIVCTLKEVYLRFKRSTND